MELQVRNAPASERSPFKFEKLVEPMGFEPTTFPVSPGRAYQFFNHAAVFPGFELPFPAHCFFASRKFLCINQFPGSAILQ